MMQPTKPLKLMKPIIKLPSLIIILFIFFGQNINAQEVSDLNSNVELIKERGMYSKVYLMKNGDRQAIFSGAPIHYNNIGNLEPIDTRIITSNEGYKNETNIIQSFFPRNVTSTNKINLLVNSTDKIIID